MRCIFGAILAALFDLTPTVKIALLLMAVSLVSAIFPRKRLKLGGRANCVFGMLVAASLCAIKSFDLLVHSQLIACENWAFEIDNVNCSNRRGSNVGGCLFRAGTP